ncbi:MAG TPA: DUF3443 domain-containing protein, partial [Terriglobales bacterium]|nr:DUF3443 domain-containing protein [Terriglobales bacterium]
NNNTVNNTQPVAVNAGPTGNGVNQILTSVKVCDPGTTTCQTIPDVLVDTGSTGLRVLRNQLTLSLPTVTDSSGNPLGACAQFVDNTFLWGSIAAADITLAGETAASVPIQVIADPSVPNIPTACSNGGTNNDTVTALGANGILGVGLFAQDCGPGCAPGASMSPPPVYFNCPSSGCIAIFLALASQLQNPANMFPQDNNGLLIRLPSVPASGSPTLPGSLIFGIGTQADNGLGSATVYTTDNVGDFTTTFNSHTSSQSFIDSGSNGFFFFDSATTGIPTCAKPSNSFYCPAVTMNLTATNKGANGISGPVPFSIANANSLFTNGDTAYVNLGGPQTGVFDWGLPFFYGRNVFVGFENKTTPRGVGPFWAY